MNPQISGMSVFKLCAELGVPVFECTDPQTELVSEMLLLLIVFL